MRRYRESLTCIKKLSGRLAGGCSVDYCCLTIGLQLGDCMRRSKNRLSEADGCTLGNAAGKLLEGCLSGEPTKNRLIDFDIDGMALCCSWGGAGLQLERAMTDGRLLDVCWVATQRLPVHLWKVTEG